MAAGRALTIADAQHFADFRDRPSAGAEPMPRRRVTVSLLPGRARRGNNAGITSPTRCARSRSSGDAVSDAGIRGRAGGATGYGYGRASGATG